MRLLSLKGMQYRPKPMSGKVTVDAFAAAACRLHVFMFTHLQGYRTARLSTYTPTGLYTYTNCIPVPHGRRSLTVPRSVPSFRCCAVRLHGSSHTSLPSYIATRLHPYRTTCKASSRHHVRQRGARNGAPLDSYLLLSYLSLSLLRQFAFQGQLPIANHNGGHPLRPKGDARHLPLDTVRLMRPAASL